MRGNGERHKDQGARGFGFVVLAVMLAGGASVAPSAGEPIQFSEPEDEWLAPTPSEKEDEPRPSMEGFDQDHSGPGRGLVHDTPPPSESPRQAQRQLRELLRQQESWMLLEEEFEGSPKDAFEKEAEEWIGSDDMSRRQLDFYLPSRRSESQGETNRTRRGEADPDWASRNERGRSTDLDRRDELSWSGLFAPGAEESQRDGMGSGSLGGDPMGVDPWEPVNTEFGAMTGSLPLPQSRFGSRRNRSAFGSWGEDDHADQLAQDFEDLLQDTTGAQPFFSSRNEGGSFELFDDSNRGSPSPEEGGLWGSGDNSWQRGALSSPSGFGTSTGRSSSFEDGGNLFGERRSSSFSGSQESSGGSFTGSEPSRNSRHSAPTILKIPRRGF